MTAPWIWRLAVIVGVLALIAGLTASGWLAPRGVDMGGGLMTPARIVPAFYELPFFAILRAVTFDLALPFTSTVLVEAKLLGFLTALAAWLAPIRLAFVDWDRAPIHRTAIFSLAAIAVVVSLGWLGAQVLTPVLTALAQLMTAVYFALFLLVAPRLARRRSDGA